MEESIPELADEIFREKVMRARSIPASEKMGLGAKLYAEVLGRMRSGVRIQFPDADDDEVERILEKRLKRLTQIEEHGIFHPLPTKS